MDVSNDWYIHTKAVAGSIRKPPQVWTPVSRRSSSCDFYGGFPVTDGRNGVRLKVVHHRDSITANGWPLPANCRIDHLDSLPEYDSIYLASFAPLARRGRYCFCLLRAVRYPVWGEEQLNVGDGALRGRAVC